MSVFRIFLSNASPFTHYIFLRGIQLSCAFLLAAILTLFRARLCPHLAWLLFAYADHFISMGAVLLGAGLFGSLLLEDLLRKRP